MSLLAVGLYAAGRVVEKQEWFGDKFGEFLMGAGAAFAIGDVVSWASGGEAVAESASVLDAEAAVPELTMAGADPAAVTSLTGESIAPSTLGADAFVPTSAEVVAGETFTPATEGLLSSGTGAAPGVVTPGAEAGFWDSKYAMPTAMVGGQALSGWAQSKAAADAEERKLKRQNRWGVSSSGDRTNLNLGERLRTVNEDFFTSREQNKPQRGGLLS